MEFSIKFLPIFNQSEPVVWDDFLRIRDVATSYSCGYSMCVNDFQAARKELERAWNRRSFNFAFGAYDDASMIGFVNGDCVGHVATIRGLYVMPDYMRQNVGGNLLKLAERVSTFGAYSLDLVSLPNAQKFYERYGYQPLFRGSNHYTKPITSEIRTKSLTIPVFMVTKKLERACSEISKYHGREFDAAHVNSRHEPMFVYIDAAAKIAGFAIAANGTDGKTVKELYIGRNQPTKIVASCLNKELGLAKQFYEAKRGHNR